MMKLKTLIGLAVAGAFALPLAAQASADGDRIILAQAGGPAGASSTGTGSTGGTPSTQSSGEPRAPTQGAISSSASTGATGGAAADFSSLDRNGDGQISRAEWDAHYRAGAGSSGMGASGSSTTGATAGPGSASNRTGTGSDTATTPGTSGHGKAQ
ncbi:MAG TPA: EF-hand domain-containing protein [Burkholderiales bacterium]